MVRECVIGYLVTIVIVVTGNSLLVTCYSCLPPPVALRAPPPAGGGGHWCVSRCDDHPAGLSPTKIVIFAGPDVPAPLRRGEPRPRRYIAKFPSIGGVVGTGPRATRRVGGQDRGGTRVRNWILRLLSPRGLTTGPR